MPKSTGRYYYPRNDDTSRDENGHTKFMHTLMSNGGMPLAYFAVKDGFWSMYNKPWDDAVLSQPQIIGVDELTTSVSQAVFVEEKAALLVTLTPGPVKVKKVAFKVANLDENKTYAIWKNDKLVETLSVAMESKKGKYSFDAGGSLVVESALSKSRPTSFVIAEHNE